MGYYEIFVVLLSLIVFCYFFHDKKGFPTNWPLLGMLPALMKNIHRFHNYFIEIMEKSHLTFLFKGPWFTNMHMLATIDPSNVHYVLSKNFGNYPKGPKFHEIFDVLGDGIFNTDNIVWQYHRKMAQSFLRHPKFHQFLVMKTWDKVENGLIPIFDHVSKHGIEIDLQDLFARFTFDTICTIIMDHDPKSLSVDLPSIPPSNALDNIEEVIFYRHVIPCYFWKFQRWLGVGKEKKYKKAWKTLDSFIYNSIDWKRQEMRKGNEVNPNFNLLASYLDDENENRKALIINSDEDKFLKDTILNFFIAGRDTTSATLSWFFYLLSKNPQVKSRIKKELDDINVKINQENFEQMNSKLIYLHGALCETLRLYPPVALQAKTPMKPDILPSGHHVNPNVQIIFDMYAMGRMKSIWGDDCNEFKPERWITERGKIKHEPSYKFLAFNAGPRTCLGKDMAFTQMKIVVASIIQNYVVEAIEEHCVVPDISIILHMKYGCKVRIHCSE
ncbi:Alkane hydroxylase MAH1 [Bienertia sinuspersici]